MKALSVTASAIACLLVGCASINASSEKEFFAKYPIHWSNDFRHKVGSDLGRVLDSDTPACAVFKSSNKKLVVDFLSQFERDFQFNDSGYSNLTPRTHLTPGEEFVVVERRDIFEVEAMAIAMLHSGLFETVYIGAYRTRGDSYSNVHFSDRRYLFSNPSKPSPDEALRFIEDFFNELCAPYGGKPKIVVLATRPEDYEFDVNISGVKNLIVPRANYWEEIQVRVSVSPVFGDESHGVAVAFASSGSYAAGVREDPPPPKKFKRLDDTDGGKLQHFTDLLSSTFRKKFHSISEEEHYSKRNKEPQ